MNFAGVTEVTFPCEQNLWCFILLRKYFLIDNIIAKDFMCMTRQHCFFPLRIFKTVNPNIRSFLSPLHHDTTFST